MYRKRNPVFRVDFITDDNNFTVMYDNNLKVDGSTIENRIINFQTKNSMQDDSAVFQITLAGDTHWDKILTVNDIMKLYVNPNPADDKEGLILVGMISQVSKVGAYGNNKVTYRITGQSFSKPFLKFGLGVIQEVQAVLPSTGWLIDGDRISFTGKSASAIMKGVLDEFVPLMKYNFTDGKDKGFGSIASHFNWDKLESWEELENLADATQLSNFDGSLKQMMDLITAKPFNELFFRNGEDGKTTDLIMRRTPFNPTQWNELDYETVTSEDLIEEDVGKSDVETYSIFTVTTPLFTKEMKPDLFSRPQYHKDLVDRYGYTKLEVDNMYVNLTGTGSTQDEDSDVDNDDGTQVATYEKVNNNLKNKTREVISNNKTGFVKELSGRYKNLRKEQAKKIVDEFVKKGKLSREYYEKVTGRDEFSDGYEDNRPRATIEDVKKVLKEEFKDEKAFEGKKKKSNIKKATERLSKEFRYGSPTQAKRLVNEYVKYKGTPPGDEVYQKYVDSLKDINNVASDTGTDATDSPMLTYSKMLFNWYHNNPNFYSGDIIVIGHHKYDLGKRLFVEDRQRNDVWEFYIESVEHSFDFQKGYTTTIGVTRGLKEATIPAGSPHRFKYFWGKSSDFTGGLLGEKSLKEMKKEAVEAKNKKKESSGDSEGANDGGSLSKLEKFDGNLPKYDYKAREGNHFTTLQCTWYCYNRRAQLGIGLKISPNNWWHDAWKWKERSKADGYSGGSNPKQGAVVVWQAFTKEAPTKYGHVAFVEKVLDGGNKIKISEYNYNTPEAYGERTIPVTSAMYFIYDKG